jgi:hypothetical protein
MTQNEITLGGMTYYEASIKYCIHDFRKNIAIGYPPIYIEVTECQICRIPKSKAISNTGSTALTSKVNNDRA